MAQFDLHTLMHQTFLTLVGFFFFYLFIKKYYLVQLRRQDLYIKSVNKFLANKSPKYGWLKFDAFSLESSERCAKILSHFKNFKKIKNFKFK